MEFPGPKEIRAAIAELNGTERKVLGGMVVLMIHNHQKIKDQEWVAESFTRVSVSALERNTEGPVDEDIQVVSTFIEKSMGPVLNVAFPLFAQVAVDMQGQTGDAGFTLEDACTQALHYFEPETPS